MAENKHVSLLLESVDAWNHWREENPSVLHLDLCHAKLARANLAGAYLRWTDLIGADLRGANLSGADLCVANLTCARLDGANASNSYLWGTKLHDAQMINANLSGAQLSGELFDRVAIRESGPPWPYPELLRSADLRGASLRGTILNNVDLRGTNLRGWDDIELNFRPADLRGAKLAQATLAREDLRSLDLTGIDLRGADLSEAILNDVNLSRADLSGANLRRAVIVGANLEHATLHDSLVYGISAWDVRTEGSSQYGLVITPADHPEITVDDLEVAQFIYLILNNPNIRNAIDTIGRKTVLILGRFGNERKMTLDALRHELRMHDLVPVIFDFPKPSRRDLTETISVLAHLARFVIADLTDAKSVPQELQKIIPALPSLPIQPIIATSQIEYSMFEDFGGYLSVLPPYRYADTQQLLASLNERVIIPAIEKAKEIEERRREFGKQLMK